MCFWILLWLDIWLWSWLLWALLAIMQGQWQPFSWLQFSNQPELVASKNATYFLYWFFFISFPSCTSDHLSGVLFFLEMQTLEVPFVWNSWQYSWPLNNAGIRALIPCTIGSLRIIFASPHLTNSLLLEWMPYRKHKQLNNIHFVCFIYYILYS